MIRPCKSRYFRSFSLFSLIAGAVLLAAPALLSPRNMLRAADQQQPASYTFAQLDSLFRTVYAQEEDPYEGSGWKPFHRFSWFYNQRAYPTGEIPPAARMQAWEEQQERQHENLDENWTPIGPTNLAGRILCLAWHPTNVNTIFAGSASGGLWKTTDAGATWFALTDQLPSLAVGAVALKPGDPNTIYIGTGEGAFNADAVYGAGIFKSTDGGTTWNPTGLSWTQSQERAINKIAINPSNTQILYAAASRAVGGVFKSTDGGASWAQYHNGDVKDLILRPDSTNILYCVDGDPWTNPQNGIFRSSDSGVTWTRLSNGLPAASMWGRAQLTLSPSNRQTMYLGISQTLTGGAGLLGVYKTTNSGASWTLQADSPNFYGGQGWYNLVIAVHPTNPAIVYSSGIDCYKSTDSGVNWTRKSFGTYAPGHSQYAHTDHHDLIFKPGDANTILAATDGGIYRSTNGGDTWSAINNSLTTYQFYAMGNDMLNSSVAYGGTQDNGTNKYTGTNSWTWVLSGDGGYCNVDYTNSNVIYAETERGSHYKSTNAGSTWANIQNGITGYGEWVTPVVMDPTNPNVLYTATTRIYRTIDGGGNWTEISSDLSAYYVSTIAVAPSNTSVIYAGCGGLGDVWKTTDLGATWTNVSNGLPDRYVTRVAVHPTSSTTVYATMSGYASGHVWKSTNGGTTWTNSSSGLPDVPCNALVIDQNTPTTLYLGTDLGTYRSTDAGATWSNYSTGLPHVVVDDLALHPATGTLRAATHGRGMWATATGSAPSIVLLTPNGGDSWPIGSSQSVTWGTGGLGGNVRIELNRNYPTGSWEIVTSTTPNDGSYAWTVLGPASSTVRVRVTSIEFPSATDISNSNFSITGSVITLLRPLGGDTLVVGSTDTVSWSISGTPGTVIVQLNRAYPEGVWTTIATTANMSAPFVVSGPSSTMARVRVLLQSNPSIGDTSAANFSIVQPSITVTWPNGGEALTPGQGVILRWNSEYVTGSKRVEINRNYPSGTWQIINSFVFADSLLWTVDESGSAAARIRVVSNSYGSVFDVSNGNFTVLTPTLSMLSPNGGEGWAIGETHTIRWTRSNLSGLVNVYCNLSYPNGPWTPIESSVSADSLTWVVPPPASGTARIRVASVNLPTFCDESNGDFSVGSGITLLSPNGGEYWSLGGQATISWTRANASGNATVQLNRSFPVGSWETLTTTASGNSFVWTITAPTSTGARVRVFLTNNSAIGDTSDASFTIISSALSLTTPNGGELWNTNTYQTIRWSRINAPGPVSVYLNRNYPAGTWDILATAVTADTFRWFVPNDGQTNTAARVRIIWNDVPQIWDMSSANFSIVPKLKLLTPVGGEVWELSSTQTIRWQRSNSPGAVRVFLTRTWPELTWITLTESAMGDSFVYIVPDYGTAEAAHVAIFMANDFSMSDTSDAGFAIRPSTALQLVSPNGGEVWPLSSTQVIRWTRRPNSPEVQGPVRILLTRTWPELTWITLTASAMADTFAYTLPPGGTSDVAHVAIYMADNYAITDTSASGFSIVPANSITVTSPNGGEQWAIGAPQTITFVRSNASGAATVQLNRNYPNGTWETLNSSVSGSSLAWTPSGSTSNNSRIRVFLNSNPVLRDSSNANFVLVSSGSSLTVNVPNGGESWAVGSSQTVSFTRNNATGDATLELNRNYPAGSWEVLSTTVGGSSFVWTVNGTTTNAARVRVYLTANPGIGDTSNANFSIIPQPTLTLTVPNGGDIWPIGGTRTVRFTRSNAVGNVAVLLNRTYPGGTWETLASTVTADSFAWAVSGATTTTARIRIYLVSNQLASDTSAGNFSLVTPSIVLNVPNGGETWDVGSTQSISFTRTNASGYATVQVNRSYPTGGWVTLSSTVIGSSYSWTVTDPGTNAARVRVYLNAIPTVGDTSNANFTIRAPSLVLTAPNGGETWYTGTVRTVTFSRALAPGEVNILLNRTYPGGSWETLATGVTADSFQWNVSAPTTSAARIRVVLASNASVADTSLANFSIVTSSLTMSLPNGGETWNVGTSHLISFVRNNAPGAATIELNRNYPSGAWELINNNVTGSSLIWTASGAGTVTARMRVYLNATPSVGDTSNGNFSLVAPGITVITPNGGDTLRLGTTCNMTWTRVNASGAVTVALNRSYPSGTWEVLANGPTEDSYAWTVSGATTINARVRVTLNSNPAVGDTSDSNLRIVASQLTLLEPNGGEVYTIGSPVTVRWTRNYAPGNVTVLLNRTYPGGTWETLTTTTLGDSFVWTSGGQASTTARVMIYLSSNGAVNDLSAGDFSLVQPSLLLTTHNGGGTCYVGTTSAVLFSRTNAPGNVTIQLKRNYPSGQWETLSTTVSGSLYPWSVTSPVSVSARLRIFLNSDPAIGDTSNGNFTIANPSLVLSSPNGGESWGVGETQTISWARYGVSENVRLEVNRNYPSGSWEIITSSAGGNSYNWSVNGPAATAARVRVTALTLGVGDTSNANFAITQSLPPSLTVVSPNGGEIFMLGMSYYFTFTRANHPGPVIVQLNRLYPNGAWEDVATMDTSSTYLWQAVSPVTETGRIRVISQANPSIGDTSDGDFRIVPFGITLISPVGGDTFSVGAPATLQWQRDEIGSVDVKLNRSYPTGPWEVIAQNVDNDSVVWNATAPASAACRVLVHAHTDPTVADTSEGNFAIANPILTVTSPNGGEVFGENELVTISWTTTYSFTSSPVRVELNRNYPSGGWETLASGVTVNSAIWQVDSNFFEHGRVRAVLEANPSVMDVCDGDFRTARPVLSLVTPNGADTLITGTATMIRWRRVNLPGDVRIELNRNYPAGSWEIITSSSQQDSLPWTVGGSSSTNARFRVTLVSDPSITDESDLNSWITPAMLPLLAPMAGDSFAVGSNVAFQWSRVGVSPQVNVYLKRSYPGGSWELIGSNISTDSWTWAASGSPSDVARFRILAAANPLIGDTTDGPVHLGLPQLALTAPSSAQTYRVGELMTIAWTRSYAPGDVRVEVSRQGVNGPWTVLGVTSGDSFMWAVTGPASNTVRFRITHVSLVGVVAMTTFNSAIVVPTLTVTSPTNAGPFAIGRNLTVTWQRAYTSDPVNVFIQRGPGAPLEAIRPSVTGDSIHWTATQPMTSDARIVLRTASGLFVEAQSVAFALLMPQVAMITPVGGESFVAGNTMPIRWSRTAVNDAVRLELNRSYPEGSWTVLNASIADTFYYWTVTGPTTYAARLRIVSTVDPAVGDTTEGSFSLLTPALTLEYPTGGSTVPIGFVTTITWSRVAVNGNVNLYLARDGFTYQNLALNVGGDAYNWTPSGAPSTNARIRITSDANPTIADTTEPFALAAPTVTLLAPLGGDTLVVGSSYLIRWTEANHPATVNVLLNRTYPSGGWETLSSDVNADSLLWQVSGSTSSTARVRVVSAVNSAWYSESTSNFAIVSPAIEITSPSPGAELVIGNSLTITWQRTLWNGTVRVLLRRSAGPTDTLAQNIIGDSHTSIVQAPPSDVSTIVVEGMTDPSHADSVSVLGPSYRLAFVDPVTMGIDTIGHVRRLEWHWAGGSSSVRLDLSRNGLDGPWELIAGSVPGTTYDYLVTGPATEELRYRVTSLVDTTVRAISVARSAREVGLVMDGGGGDTWYIGEQHWIRWSRYNYDGVVNVEVQRLNRSQPWELIAESTSDSILWTVPGPATDFAILRLMAAEYPDVFDTTDAPISIVAPNVTVVAPNGGELLEPGSEIRLRWIGEGLVGGVDIGLWRGEPVNQLDTLFIGAANDSNEIWTITGPAAADCYLIVRSVQNPALWDTSDARFEITGGTAADPKPSIVPQTFVLEAPYPNPFNSRANIPFAVAKSGNVRLTVYDLLGREVATLVNEIRSAGFHSVSWDATNAASGVYFVRMTSADFVATRKLNLLK